MTSILLATALALASAAPAQADKDARATFEKFVKAQNDHDLAAVGELLLDSPDFLWVTKGSAIWGREPALKRFKALYNGTWKLEPETGALKLVALNAEAFEVHVPIVFTIGEPGQEAKRTRFLMTMLLVSSRGHLKVASILPIQAAIQP